MWLDDETFEFFVPATAIDITKGSKADKTGRWIQGIASTNARDLQGEILDQNGIDFTYFLNYGYFNDDHKSGISNKVGEPTECRLTQNGLWVKGFLYKNKEASDKIWEHLNALDASGSRRKVGFSVQGKVKRREGNMIKDCWIQDVAITPAPVNTTTWAEIAKSLSAMKWDVSKAQSPDFEDEDEEKKEEDKETNKAQAAGGSPLVPESLEGKQKEDRTAKSLTFSDAVSFLQQQYSMPEDDAEATARVVFSIF